MLGGGFIAADDSVIVCQPWYGGRTSAVVLLVSLSYVWFSASLTYFTHNATLVCLTMTAHLSNVAVRSRSQMCSSADVHWIEGNDVVTGNCC